MWWLRAAQFTSQDKARGTWKKLYNEVMTRDINLFITSIIYGANWYVCAMSESTPEPRIVKIVEKWLATGTPSELPVTVWDSLKQRRVERRSHASPTGQGYAYESHNPKVLPYVTSDAREYDEDAYIAHMTQVISSLTAQGTPYPEIYKAYLEQNLQARSSVVSSSDVARTYIEIVRGHVDRADYYMLTDTARAMHSAVYEGNGEWVDLGDNSIWIEQDTPQTFPGMKYKVKAVLVHPVLDGGINPCFVVSVIDEYVGHSFVMIYDRTEKTFEPTIDYQCPYKQCKNVKAEYADGLIAVYRQPCTQCQATCDSVASWLHTTMRMIRRDYATTLDPEPFSVRNVVTQSKKLVPRHHGKGRPKEKTVTSSIPYTVIAYDISIKPTGTGTGTARDTDNQDKRANWLVMHSRADMIYERKFITDTVRRYSGEYYKALIARVRSGERTSPDGEEYELEQSPDGTVSVIGRVRYPNGKMVPMLRPDVKKSRVVKKVTARIYEKGAVRD